MRAFTMSSGARSNRRGEGGGVEGGRFLLQHRQAALPTREGTGSISLDVQFLPRRRGGVPRLSRFALRARRCGGSSRGVDGGGSPLPRSCLLSVDEAADALAGLEEGGASSSDAARPRFGLFDSRRAYARAFGRRGSAAEACGRAGQEPGGVRVRVRRAYHRTASA